LTCRNGYWYVKDLNSRNGTKVNGKRVTQRRIDPGDTVSVAKHRYEFVYAPAELGAVGPPPPEDNDAVSEIMGNSLLERAGLNRRPNEGGERRYDLERDDGGRFKDPNRPI
jgi:adenylate cyclase